ncbi:FRG domain-containing protein [Yeosuana sp. AK3]
MIEKLIKKYQGTRITSIEELRPIIKEIQELRLYYSLMENYRGQSLRTFKLNSGLARFSKKSNQLKKREKKLFRDFSCYIKVKKNYIRNPFSSDTIGYKMKNKWYSLFQAQHLGLKTRLMDWTIDWVVALMFAVENNEYFGKDGSLYIFLVPDYLLFNDPKIKKVTESTDPFNIDQDLMINTPIFLFDNELDFVGERRLSRQSGRFWMQSIENSIIPLNEQSTYKTMLIELIIDGASKENIKKELEKSGVTKNWHYYRTDENIDDAFKLINKIHLENNIFQKLINYTKLVFKYILEMFR